MVLVRKFIVTSLADRGIFPGSTDYFEFVQQFILDEFSIDATILEDKDPLKQEIDSFVNYFVKSVRFRWKKSYRKLSEMLKKSDAFFNEIVNFENLNPQPQQPPQPQQLQQPPVQPKQPKKSFESMSKSHKMKAAQDIRKSADSGAVLMAAQQLLRREGQGDTVYVLKRMNQDPEETPRCKFQKKIQKKVPTKF
jgi:hypothetical protein